MMSRLKGWVKKRKGLKRVSLWLMRILAPIFLIVNVLAIPRYFVFLYDWRRFRKAGGVAKILDFYPCLNDRTTTTAVDTHCFNQAIWALKRIMESGTKQHVDIGSDVKFVGMLTTITDVTFVDIRPLEIKLKGFNSKCGSIVALPFDDGSISSLSSMHVIEHVGLGRYGDPIDPLGTVRASKELSRVLAPGGKLYLSVPIGESKVQFNGQRIFAIEEIVRLFSGLCLVEFSFVDTDGTYRENAEYPSVKLRDDTGQDAGLGLFLFEAIQAP